MRLGSGIPILGTTDLGAQIKVSLEKSYLL